MAALGQGLWRQAWHGLRGHGRVHVAVVATLVPLLAVLLALAALTHDLLLKPWSYDSQRLGVLNHGLSGASNRSYGFAPDEYRALRSLPPFAAFSASQSGAVALGDGTTAARSLLLSRTQPEALAVTDGRPLLGRFIEPGDYGNDSIVVISHALWQSEFHGAGNVLGRTLLIDGRPRTVIGVMPPGFHFQGGDLWQALPVDPARDNDLNPRLVLNFKLRPEAGIAEVAAPLAARVEQLPRRASDPQRYPRGWSVSAVLVLDAVVGPLRPAVLLVLGGAGLLLLLGLANVAALLLARQLDQSPVLATRLALGEGRPRMVVVAALESLLLAAAALALAVPLSAGLVQVFAGWMSVEWVPRELEGRFSLIALADPRWLLALPGLALCLLLVRVPGLLRLDARVVLHASPRTGGHSRQRYLLTALSALQIALAGAVGVATLAIVEGSADLAQRDLGFQPQGAMHAQLIFPAHRYPDSAARISTLDRVSAQLQSFPGVQSVGFIDSPPLQRYARNGVLAGWSGHALDTPQPIDYRAAHGALAPALGLRLREGRWLDPSTDRADSEPVAVIGRALATQLTSADGAPASALGLSIRIASGSQPQVVRRVVGVVDDIRHEGALATSRPLVYVPYAQEPGPGAPGGRLSLLLRFDPAAPTDLQVVARAIAAVDPWIALFDVQALPDRARRALAGVTLAQQLFATFAGLGLLLAMLGIGAVAALIVRSRRHELGVRGALGAGPRRLGWQILQRNLRNALLASALGLGLAVLLVQGLGVALPGVARSGWQHWLLVPLLLTVLSACATAIPARQAMRVDPLGLLRGRG